MRGIILAGGAGTRLYPLTSQLSKQILPVYDKPMIYYPLATLMAAGIREIMIISTPRDLSNFQSLFGNGGHLGLSISYSIQPEPKGIAEAFLIAGDFVRSSNCALILGDNLFHGTGLGRQLMDLSQISGCQIFAYKVADSSNYGVVRFNDSGEPTEIEEKPKTGAPGFAIPGLYFFDGTVVDRATKIRPSSRGELEITSLLNLYLEDKELSVSILPRGTAWLDTGTVENLHDASSYVRLIEERQGSKIACIEEVAWRQGWISTQDLSILATELAPSPYAEYLESLISEEASRTW
jgi:glucose-1-phosphate thymidylyltransferase